MEAFFIANALNLFEPLENSTMNFLTCQMVFARYGEGSSHDANGERRPDRAAQRTVMLAVRRHDRQLPRYERLRSRERHRGAYRMVQARGDRLAGAGARMPARREAPSGRSSASARTSAGVATIDPWHRRGVGARSESGR